MTDAKRAEQATREAILELLSDEETARVSTAETATALTEGAEYVDLEQLDRGVQRAKAAAGCRDGARPAAQRSLQGNLDARSSRNCRADSVCHPGLSPG